MEGQPIDVRNIRYNTQEDLLSHMHAVLDFSNYCRTTGIPPESFYDTFSNLVHHIALCLDTICRFATIYFGASAALPYNYGLMIHRQGATYKAVCIVDLNALTLFSRCHEALLHSRARLTNIVQHRPAELANIPLPYDKNSFSVLDYLYRFAKTELRLDPNWPTNSFTAALIGIRGPIFNAIVAKIRAVCAYSYSFSPVLCHYSRISRTSSSISGMLTQETCCGVWRHIYCNIITPCPCSSCHYRA